MYKSIVTKSKLQTESELEKDLGSSWLADGSQDSLQKFIYNSLVQSTEFT